MRIALAKFGVIGLGKGDARHQQSLGVPGAVKRCQVLVYTTWMIISRNWGTQTHFQRQMMMDQTLRCKQLSNRQQ